MEHSLQIPDHRTYGASPDGRIWDYRKEIELNYINDMNGYKRVYLHTKNGIKLFSVSRLVGSTFIPNPDNKPEIDHIDRCRTNNKIENLRWVNDNENAINKVGFGKYPKCIYFEQPSQRQKYQSWVIQIRNHKLKFKKRYKTTEYTLEQIIQIRNELFTQNNLPITD